MLEESFNTASGMAQLQPVAFTGVQELIDRLPKFQYRKRYGPVATTKTILRLW